MAFRDIALEIISRRMLETYFKTSKLGDNSFIPDSVLLEEPHKISESVEFSKTIQGLLDISFRAWNIRISGLQDSRIEEFHFVRHIGLRDVRIVGQISSNVTFYADYEIKGSGLNLLDLKGSGGLKVSVTRLLVTSEVYVVVREDKQAGSAQLFVNDINLKIRKETMRVELENILGGGFVGDIASQIITLVGEDFLRTTKEILSRKLGDFLKTGFQKILDVESYTFL